jgi:hypothetical protein
MKYEIRALETTNVLTAYLKNSVTSLVDPLRLMACRVGGTFVFVPPTLDFVADLVGGMMYRSE